MHTLNADEAYLSSNHCFKSSTWLYLNGMVLGIGGGDDLIGHPHDANLPSLPFSAASPSSSTFFDFLLLHNDPVAK